MRSIVFAVAIVIVLSAPAAAQPAAPTQDFRFLVVGNDFRGWVVEHPDRNHANVADGVLTMKPNAGVVHTEETRFRHFALRFDARALAPSTTATLALFGSKVSKDAPFSALGVPLLHPSVDRPDRVDFASITLDAAAFEHAIKPSEAWQSYEIVRLNYALRVQLNGELIGQQYLSPAHDGWIGVQVTRGEIAIRNLRFTTLTSDLAGEASDFPGAFRSGQNVKLPTLVKEVKPSYTSAAMNAKIQGAAMVECVVLTDGTVGEARIVRSLDNRYGLDAEALKAAKRWLFKPGTKDGVPVPVVITIELTFTLRK
jgi:TonB family protein